MTTNQKSLVSDYINSTRYVAHSKKLKDLKHYRNHKIYYIVNEGLWIINDYLENTSHINYAIVYIDHVRNKGSTLNLILHNNCMLVDDGVEHIKFPHKITDKDYGRRIESEHIDLFIDFLDNNNNWLNKYAALNHYIDFWY